MLFGPDLSLEVDVPSSLNENMCYFVDEIINCVCFNQNWKLLAGAALLALHVFSCPLPDNEPTHSDDLVALNELVAEGAPNEIQIILG